MQSKATLVMANTASHKQWARIFSKHIEWCSQVTSHGFEIEHRGFGKITGHFVQMFGNPCVTVVGDEEFVLALSIVCGYNIEERCLLKIISG